MDKRIEPGEARSTGPSVQDVLRKDGDNPPDAFTEESYRFMGDADLSADRYTSQEFHDLEMKHMWSKVWQMACHEDEIPEPGDNLVYEIGDYSFIIARVTEDTIKAFVNSCLHRGTQLRPSDSIGSTEQFRCPFHGWTWNLDGSLKEIPCRWDFPKVSDEDYRLPEVKVDIWGGFVFLNMDPDSVPLEEWLAPLPEHFRTFPMERRFMTANVRRIMDCNWKVAQEAFIESYHVVEAHAQAMPMTGDANTQYDIWGDRTSRLYTMSGVSSPHMEAPLSDQEMANILMAGVGAKQRDGNLDLQPGETARSVYADALRKEMKGRFGADLSHLTITEVLDNIEYFAFPNFFPWFNFSLPLVYRFRPYGNDPDKSIMDVMLMHPAPDGEPRPEPAPLHVLGSDEDFLDATELDQISPIFEQDVANMPRVQRGLKAATKGVTIGNYQEIRLRHMHQTLDKYIEAGIAAEKA